MILSMSVNVFATDWESEIDVAGVAVVNNVYYNTLQEAIDNANGNVITLLADAAEAVTATGEVHLDLNGFTANVTAAKIYAYDASATTAAAGTGKLVTTSAVEKLTVNNNVRYIATKDADGNYTAHAFSLRLSVVSLRTNKAGIYYTAKLTCDETVTNAVQNYGVILSVKSMPGADFETANVNGYTVYTGKPAGEFTSGSVFNIFKESLSAANNATRGEMKIYANAYLRLTDGTIVLADTGVTYSLQDVMVELDTNLEDYTDKKEIILDFYKTWKDAMANWNLNNIAAA
jgi:hypothetical protein